MTMTKREELNLQAINVDKDIHTVVKKFCDYNMDLVYSVSL
jgi:hypothetical protein